MKTVGEYLREARIKKKHSLAKVEEETKIKKKFIKAIEKGNWNKLPEYTVVVGFVKNLASYLDLNMAQAIALLRRDYPPPKFVINPNPNLERVFKWSPRLTFFAGSFLVVGVALSYLFYQYVRFISPPKLSIIKPLEDEIVTTTTLQVLGKTDSGAVVKVNNQPVIVDGDGNFETEIEISKDTEEVAVKATSRSGKETNIVRKIKVELIGD